MIAVAKQLIWSCLSLPTGQYRGPGGNAAADCVWTLTITGAADAPTFTGFGCTVQVELAGAPAQANVADPLNPLIPRMLKL